jgi:hypothetical protein
MEVAPPEAQELFAALCLGGNSAPHKVAEALSLLLPLLPLDARARAASVCRAWRAAAANPLLWEELNFERCTARVSNATLAQLCARSGAALRTLRLDKNVFEHVSDYGVLAALRGGGCTGLSALQTPPLALGLLQWPCRWSLRVRCCCTRRSRCPASRLRRKPCRRRCRAR